MKKKILTLLVVSLLAILCVGCSNGSQNDTSDTQNLNKGTEDSIVDNDSETDKKTDVIVYSQLSKDAQIQDEDMLKQALDLVVDESAFVTKLDTVWPNSDAVYEINGGQYLLVGEATGWSYYEELARNYYSEEYIKEEFTPWYTEDGRVFFEQDGKLYRAMSDGIGTSVISDTIEVWQAEEDLYYITIQYDSDIENDVRGFVVRKSEGKAYGFEIVEKLNVVK